MQAKQKKVKKGKKDSVELSIYRPHTPPQSLFKMTKDHWITTLFRKVDQR